jgi:hypothetical protein
MGPVSFGISGSRRLFWKGIVLQGGAAAHRAQAFQENGEGQCRTTLRSSGPVGIFFCPKMRAATPNTDFSRAGEIRFWTGQFAEHVLFEAAGLDLLDPGLREMNTTLLNNALVLNKTFMEIHAAEAPSGGLETLSGDLKSLRTQEEFLLDETKRRYIGLVFPAMVDHHLDELRHLEEVISATPPGAQELLRFYADMHREHMELDEHLLDPSEPREADECARAAEAMARLKHGVESGRPLGALLSAARKEFAALDAFYRRMADGAATRRIKSIISPMLAYHMQREGERASAALSALPKT